jgi:hypothetical protein
MVPLSALPSREECDLAEDHHEKDESDDDAARAVVLGFVMGFAQ